MRVLEPRGTLGLTIAAIGDIGLVGSARARAEREGWDAPFAPLRETLSAADQAFANLEFPIGERAWVRPGRSEEFFQDAEVPAALARAGVRIVSLANNHMMDCGELGLLRTLEACRQSGLTPIGAGRDLAEARTPARTVVRGQRVVWLGYGTASDDAAGVDRVGIAPLEASLVAEDCARWRPEADLLVVSVHWGSMYVDYPPPRVTEAAEAIFAAGADLIIGHHPHVLQGAQQRGAGLVLYSLGDAVFNCRAGDFHAQIAVEKRLESGVFTVLVASEAMGLEVTPTRLDDDGFPQLLAQRDRQAPLARLEALGHGLADAARSFASNSAPTLLQYELQSLGTYLRQGRWDRVFKLLGSVRPRHLPLLWAAVSARGKRPAARERLGHTKEEGDRG
ncbi:MAG: CapA family protein [Candidatus Eisenbacteria bacterium]